MIVTHLASWLLAAAPAATAPEPIPLLWAEAASGFALGTTRPLAEPQSEDPGNKALEKAWRRLSPDEKREVTEWFRYEVQGLRTFQALLIKHAVDSREEDAGLAPEARPPRYFDPEEHAPKLPIARKWLEADSSRVKKERERLLGKPDPARISASWDYDWGLQTLVRTGEAGDPDVVFANALLGLAPDADLAYARILEVLDRGDEQVVLEAFSHSYTDRKGNAYAGITLYDAWGSGQRIEMPDVDNLGIVHTVLREKRKWRSPVPERKQDSLYEAVGEQFTRAKRYRALREALAALYLRSEPPVPAGYETNLVRLHALWEEVSSTPAALVDELPGSKDWQKYLEKLLRRVDADGALTAKARARQARLASDEAAIRQTLIRVLRSSGALPD